MFCQKQKLLIFDNFQNSNFANQNCQTNSISEKPRLYSPGQANLQFSFYKRSILAVFRGIKLKFWLFWKS